MTETKRTRVLAQRQSRNGCYTCKERKIKCDETLPHCMKCLKSQRKCGGYSTWSRRESPDQSSSMEVSLSSAGLSSLRSGIQSRGEQFHFFEIGRDFLCHEMHDTAGLADQFWKALLPQVAQSDPGTHAACIVLGAAVMHHRDKSFNRFETVSRFYSRAVRQIQHDLVARPIESTSLASMCLTLVVTDLLMGRHGQALAHLEGSLALLRCRQETPRILQSASANGDEASDEPPGFDLTDVIDIAALSLDICATSYASDLAPRLPSPHISSHSLFSELSPTLMGQELQVLRTLHASYGFINRAANFKYTPVQFRPRDIEIDQGRHIASLLSIIDSVSLTLEQSAAQDDRRLLVLRMQCRSCLIWVASVLNPEECVYDIYTESFRDIVADAKVVSSRKRPGHPASQIGFSADLGLVQPLSFTAMKCRDLGIRSAAIEQLDANGTDGPFEARIFAAIARRVVELETLQEQLTGTASTLSILVPERNRVCGCGPDLDQIGKVGDAGMVAFFSRCTDVRAMMDEDSPDGYEKAHHWNIWTETLRLRK